MLLNKSDLPLVAMDFMNEVHYEDVDIINTLFELVLTYEQEPTEENYLAINEQYETWYAHTVDHFQGEEIKMQEMNFPPYPMHKGEHDKGLHRMNEVYQEWKKSKNILGLKIYLIEELSPWLVHHIQTMDTITASFFNTGAMSCGTH
ncbi:MAG: hemerythrin family protein [Sulfurovum sp.]|nr:hemerythrin family protein [Sulfurovum sp.]